MTDLFASVRTMSTWCVSRLRIRSERGATAVEYGLMVALIAAVIIAAVVFLGQATRDSFDCTGSSLSSKSAAC